MNTESELFTSRSQKNPTTLHKSIFDTEQITGIYANTITYLLIDYILIPYMQTPQYLQKVIVITLLHIYEYSSILWSVEVPRVE